MAYQSWQGPALSKADRAAYEHFRLCCKRMWDVPEPQGIEKYIQDTHKISSSPAPYLAERGVSMISKY
jgi:hypothetical protein